MQRIAVATALVLACSMNAFGESRPEHEAQRKQSNEAYQAGEFARVIELTSGILTANPTDDIAKYLRGSARVELGIAQRNASLVREGIADARDAISNTKSGSFNYYLPYLYGMTNLGMLEKHPAHAKVSVDIATQLLTQQNVDAESRSNIFYQRGLARNSLGEANGAVEDFRAAIAAQKHLGAYMAMADTLAQAGQAEQVLQTYSQAAQAFPMEPLVYNNQGMFLQQMGRANDAVRAFTAALQRNPSYFVALTNRGYSYLEGGNAAEAEKDFNASLQMNPSQLGVYGLRGTSKLVRGQWQQAVADYETVVRTDPGNYIAHSDVGFAKYFGQDYAGALDSFNRVIQINREARFINPWRCWTLIRLKRNQEAAVIADASRQKPEAQRDWIDYLILFHVGDLSTTQLLGIAAKADKQVQAAQLCEARFYIAEQFALQGKTQEAAASYQQALDTKARQLSAYRGSMYALKRFE